VLGPVFLILSTPFVARFSKPWHWILPVLLLAVSAYSTYTCARDPWQTNQEWTVRLFGPRL